MPYRPDGLRWHYCVILLGIVLDQRSVYNADCDHLATTKGVAPSSVGCECESGMFHRIRQHHHSMGDPERF